MPHGAEVTGFSSSFDLPTLHSPFAFVGNERKVKFPLRGLKFPLRDSRGKQVLGNRQPYTFLTLYSFCYPVTDERENRRMRASMSAATSDQPDVTATLGKVKRAPSSASSTSSCTNNNNNNDSGKGKKQQGQHTSTAARRRRWCCGRYHLNSVWSIWYCLVTLGFLAYLVLGGVKRFLAYAALPWPKG